MKRVLVIVLALAAALVGLIALRLRAQSRAENGPPAGSGVVEAEGVDLASRLAARVLRVHAAEGQRVTAGAVVLELECDEPRAKLAEASARLEAAKAQVSVALAQASAARGQSAAAQASIGAMGAQAGALQTQYALATRDAERMEALGEHAALAARDRARATAAGLADQERAATASQVVSRRQATASLAQAEAARAQADAAQRNAQALEAQVTSASLLVNECQIRAPWTGLLERVYYDPGELVMLGALVARLIDPSDVSVTFYLANADLARARVGMPARVAADAYPGREFGATVTRIGLTAEFTPRNVQTRSDRDRLVYPVEVAVKDPGGALRTGMQAVVTLPESVR